MRNRAVAERHQGDRGRKSVAAYGCIRIFSKTPFHAYSSVTIPKCRRSLYIATFIRDGSGCYRRFVVSVTLPAAIGVGSPGSGPRRWGTEATGCKQTARWQVAPARDRGHAGDAPSTVMADHGRTAPMVAGRPRAGRFDSP